MDQRQLRALMAQLNAGGAAGGQFSGPPAALEFKAGKMNYNGRLVTPDRRKGWVRVVKDPMQPGMVTFQWCDEQKNVQDSFILFPDMAKFEKVKQSDDRVYLLEIQPEPRRCFFWMQEPDKEKDAERCQKCHNLINGVEEPSAAASNNAPSAQAAQPQMQESGFQMSAQGAAQHQVPGGNQAAQFANLQQLMQQMQQQQEQNASPSLQNIITPEALQTLFDGMSEEDKNAMKEHMPENQRSDEDLKNNLLSPQLRQALGSLTQAVRMDEANVEMIQVMNEIEPQEGGDGMQQMIMGFVKKYLDENGNNGGAQQ